MGSRIGFRASSSRQRPRRRSTASSRGSAATTQGSRAPLVAPPELLALQVFPRPAGQEKTIEYTLESCRRTTRRAFHPRSRARTDACRAGRVAPAVPRDNCSSTVRPPRRIAFPLAEAPPRSRSCRGTRHDGRRPRDGRLRAERVLSHYAVRAAPRLSELPRGAQRGRDLDGSRSFDRHERASGAKSARDACAPRIPTRASRWIFILFEPRGPRAPSAKLRTRTQASAALEQLADRSRETGATSTSPARADALLAAAPARVPRTHRRSSPTDGVARRAHGRTRAGCDETAEPPCSWLIRG